MFTVIVPVNRPWQFEQNILASPGLAEVKAQIIAINEAGNAAQAFYLGKPAAHYEWIVYAHQDVFFPEGSGHAIVDALKDAPHDRPIGFAGMDQDGHFVGKIVDRGHAWDYPGCDDAITLDECAVILHRDALIEIEPMLGWHLWATDLCLQAGSGVVLPIQIEHNSITPRDADVSESYRASAAALLAIWNDRNTIKTLCSTLNRFQPDLNICVVKPRGYEHSAGLMDAAVYFAYMFRRLGAKVTIDYNHLRNDVTNLVFGAHMGFPFERDDCIIVDLEQAGADWLSDEYRALLARSPVLSLADVRFGYAPYLDLPRPDPKIDILFYGSMNDRRRAWLNGTGLPIRYVQKPVYGESRDLTIRSSNAVINCHAYEGAAFEKVRAFQVLSMGTELISEGPIDPDYAPFVTWIDEGQRGDVEAFKQFDPIEDYKRILELTHNPAKA